VAVIKFSAIVSDIRGRLGDSVFSFCRGTHYVKPYNGNVIQPNTPRQQEIRGNFSYFTGVWYDLPPTYKRMWRQYASLLNENVNGFNVFLRHNLRLADANHADFSEVLFPPQTVVPVKYPYPFSAVPVDSASNLISWVAPHDDSNYIQLFFNLEWNYSCGFNKHWAFIETKRSDESSISHAHTFPPGTIIYYRLRALNKLGKISPYTHSLTVTVP